MQAELRDGILRLELPKAESARPRTIPVNGLVRGAPSAVGLPAQGGAGAANGAAPRAAPALSARRRAAPPPRVTPVTAER